MVGYWDNLEEGSYPIFPQAPDPFLFLDLMSVTMVSLKIYLEVSKYFYFPLVGLIVNGYNYNQWILCLGTALWTMVGIGLGS